MMNHTESKAARAAREIVAQLQDVPEVALYARTARAEHAVFLITSYILDHYNGYSVSVVGDVEIIRKG